VSTGAPTQADRLWFAKVLLATLAVSVLLIFIYYVIPVGPLSNSRVLVRLTIGIVAFVAVIALEVRAILRSDRPMSRAWLSMGIIIPLFIVMFSSLYVAMALANEAAFGGELSRTEALYFTITVLSTVGFGDITPKTDAARVITMIQMVLDLVLLGALAKLIIGAASHRSARIRSSQADEGQEESPLGPDS
jgi:voltage-gated potassium channel